MLTLSEASGRSFLCLVARTPWLDQGMALGLSPAGESGDMLTKPRSAFGADLQGQETMVPACWDLLHALHHSLLAEPWGLPIPGSPLAPSYGKNGPGGLM